MNQKTKYVGLALSVAAWLVLPLSNLNAQTQSGTARSVDLHRAELEYRLMIERDENGNIPANALVNAVQQAKQMPFSAAAWPGTAKAPTPGRKTPIAGIDTNLWTWIGPGNIGGRVRCILTHPTNPNVLWAGGADGGVWKTMDGGGSWAPLNDFMANLAVVTLAMDPTNPNVIYAGTGEGAGNADAIQGAGIFKTTDGGTTWAQLTSTANSSFYFVDRLSVCPTNGSIILAATRNGIWRSADGGNTWSQQNTAANMLDLMFASSGGNAIASSGDGTLLYSTDAGVTWSSASGISTSSRIEVAYAQSSPNIVYASVDEVSGEIFVSNDGGQTYSYVSNPGHLGAQGWYANCIWVDPTNPNLLVVGGLDLWRSTDGGNSFTQISDWQSAPNSAHADHHCIVNSSAYDGVNNKTVFFGNDGGVYEAADVTTVALTSGWTDLNNTLGITQFYGAAGNNTSGTIVGGAQDNGTLHVLGNGPTGSWTAMFGGDGGFCAADQSDTNYFYGEYVYLQIHRSSDAGLSSSYITAGLGDAGLPNSNGVFQSFMPVEKGGGRDTDGGGGVSGDPESAANFIAPFILDPNNYNTLLAGGSNLWRSVNAKAAFPSWAIIKPGIASGRFINAIAVAAGNSDLIWVGHNDGAVFYTTNGTATNPTWFQSGSGTLPARACTRLTIDPNNPGVVYATFGGYSSGNLYKTINGGATWSNIGGTLPAAPAHTIVVAPFNSSYLYVGMNVGIFASTDGGATWSSGNLGAANVAVDELFWMGNTLLAATHGRGLFKVAIIPDPLQLTPGAGFAASGYVGGPFSNTNQTFVLTNVGSGSLNWSLSNTSAWLQVSLASGTLTPGGPSASVTVSLSAAATNLPAGNYAATINFTNTSDGYVQTPTFTLQVQTPPDSLQISPAGGLVVGGVPGNISGASLNFTLTNIETVALNWSLLNTSVWFNVTPTSGALAGSGGAATVNVTTTAAANALPTGTYLSTVWFTNRTDGVVQTRPVVLMIQTPILNGGFETGDFSDWTPGGNFQFCSVINGSPWAHSGTYGAQFGPSGSLGYL